jgi:DNA mismatch endonuclease (patch repair protein)
MNTSLGSLERLPKPTFVRAWNAIATYSSACIETAARMPTAVSRRPRRAFSDRGSNETELALIRVFRAQGITGWRRHQPVFGKPDFIFPKLRLAVFVDGCFWHGCPRHATKPKNNAVFWRRKLAANQARDRLVTRRLRGIGWRVLRLWEHDLARKRAARLVAKVRRFLTG